MKKTWMTVLAAVAAAGILGAGTAQADWLSDQRAKRAAEEHPVVQQTVQQPVVQQPVQPAAQPAPSAAPQQAAQQNWIQQAATAQQQPAAARQQAGQTSHSSNKQNTRWLEVFQTPNYTIYIDKTSIEASGEAQDRKVSGWFRRVYNPAGAAWLGNSSNGAVRGNAIAYSVYWGTYGIYESHGRNYSNSAKYYDAEGHLIFDGKLPDRGDDYAFGRYVPDDFNERIRDTLFRMVGWDY